ncbi:MAG: helicase [Candidatus Viridilinea halotolerans]|uniref:Helicase n=1 Tax=Candidatus Viridilinea halotolerans TaxID=2491704 RepID=A0A426TQU5_9CHLR|nr:MAG: helicase [Candidatus Viridilinea halotolerans]
MDEDLDLGDENLSGFAALRETPLREAPLRDQLEDLVVRQLLGPWDGPEEIVDEPSVRGRYLVGMLAPRGSSGLPEEYDDGELGGSDGEDGTSEAPPPKATTAMLPSSIGLTFAVERSATALLVTACWGRYERVEVQEDRFRRPDGSYYQPWKRTPIVVTLPPLPLTPGKVGPLVITTAAPGVTLQGVIRKRQESWIVTLFLVNGQEEPKRGKDSAWVFQPEIRVADSAQNAIFRRRPHVGDQFDLEDQLTAMLYRHEVEFAAGHGVAVDATLARDAEQRAIPDCAVEVRTVVLPTYEVPQTTPPTAADPGFAGLATLTVDMAVLAQVPDGQFAAHLAPLADSYATWIERQAARLTTPTPDLLAFIGPGEEALRRCRKALERMRAGIALLDHDPQAAAAFRFANRAMALQRTRSLFAAAIRRGSLGAKQHPAPVPADFDRPEDHTWRAFQLGFFLLNLPALSDPRHAERRAPEPDGRDPDVSRKDAKTQRRDPDVSRKDAKTQSRDLEDENLSAFAALREPSDAPLREPSDLGDDDALADLLWFPTGGGKTEAYLGLTAYALAIRRLQGVIGERNGMAGVAVLMRYTLRLLTLQQFQRAATLICACEVIRREDPARWGAEPFRIGLWVGQRSTPNWIEDADEAIKQLKKGGTASGGSPYQLKHCPWCGTAIDPGRDLVVETPEQGRSRVLIYCGSLMHHCPFNARQAAGEGLPVIVVDEEIYHRVPSLLIATVDKFAQMPWNGRVTALFGQVSGYCERHGYLTPASEHPAQSHPALKGGKHAAASVQPTPLLRPPDLIIQDELHLISGPLGTLVGLYEAAIDHLATWRLDGGLVRPKVIASTATIRRADQQVHSLFFRRVAIFPPQGLDASDNFFALQRPPSATYPGRRYLGICAPGIRHKTALIQAYVVLLAAAQQLYSAAMGRADPYMTLVGYFNALRELAAMRRAVDDTVSTRLKKMGQRGLAPRFLDPWSVRELTSRLSASDIPEMLDRLDATFDPTQRPEKGSKRTPAQFPVDVLLATNMISVGVDVSRLGLMVVAGQPKSTAEYIQATSRVGRQHPGLVTTIYNWARPRDMSHYERFKHYHATFYQHVEALSVTPFSPRALDRGLSGVLVALARLSASDCNPNLGASRVNTHAPALLAALATVIHRAAAIAGPERATLIHDALQERLDHWNTRKDSLVSAKFGYQKAGGDTIGLLSAPDEGDWSLFAILNSLRDVEPTVNLVLEDGGLDGGGQNWEYEPET